MNVRGAESHMRGFLTKAGKIAAYLSLHSGVHFQIEALPEPCLPVSAAHCFVSNASASSSPGRRITFNL